MQTIADIITGSVIKATENKADIDVSTMEKFIDENFESGDTFTMDDIAEDVGEEAGGFINPREIAAILDELEEDGKLDLDSDTYTVN
jgi:hypothetical protein